MSAERLVTGILTDRAPKPAGHYTQAVVSGAHVFGEAVAMRVIVINASTVGIPMVSGVAGYLIGAAGVFWAAGLMVGAGVRLALGLRHPRR